MSALGHQRTWRLRFVMSVLTQQADIYRRQSQVRFGPIVLQKSPPSLPIGKMGNIRMRRAGFLNQNSSCALNSGKTFFASEPKIVLQQYRPIPDSWLCAISDIVWACRRWKMAHSAGLSWEAQEVFQRMKSFNRLPGASIPMIQLNMKVGSARTVKKGIPELKSAGLITDTASGEPTLTDKGYKTPV